jgi:hypothetical protein
MSFPWNPNSEQISVILILFILLYCHDLKWLLDGVWIVEYIYWPLTGLTRNNYNTIAISTLYTSLLHAIASSVYYSLHHPFPGNEF